MAATGLAQNKWAQLQHLAGDKVTVGFHWGQEPELCEGIPAEILLPVAADRVQFYPLDESGNAARPCRSKRAEARPCSASVPSIGRCGMRWKYGRRSSVCFCRPGLVP